MKGIVSHPVIGDITVSRSHRAKRILLTVRPDGSVRLSHPVFVSRKRALAFLEEKCDWVIASREKLQNRYPSSLIGENFRTRRHGLRFQPWDDGTVSVKIRDGVVSIRHPREMEHSSEQVQRAAGKGIVEALRKEAKELLPDMVGRLADRHGFLYGQVRVKASRSKWGSCTARNDINLSLFIVLLPDHLAEYIVLHELCHTVHKDHSVRFHSLLDRVTDGRHRALNRELRAYRPEIWCGK